MNTGQLDRIVFHSKEDLSTAYYLAKVEKLLDRLDLSRAMQINDLLELYNVKEYFDNGLFLLKWDKNTKIDYLEKVRQAEIKIREFFFRLDDGNLLEAIEEVDFQYHRAFWHLFNYLQIYKRIKKELFSQLLERQPCQIRYILTHLNTVSYFDKELRDFLVVYEETAELLLSKFEQGDRSKEALYIFPKSLSIEDKENIVSTYIDLPQTNLNYIRLIEHSKDSNDLKFSVKTRLKAKKKSEELNNKIFEDGLSTLMGVQITYDKDQQEPVKVFSEGHRINYSYSVNFMDERPDDRARFMLFRNLFGYTDHNGLVTLYHKESENCVLERITMKSKNEYIKGIQFHQKNQTALLQLISFNRYLIQKNRSIEELIQSFIQLVLNKDFGVTGLQLRFPGKNSTYLERIRIFAPELEFLLKQYQVYVREGKVDFELIEIDSTPLKFDYIKSIFGKKYVYSNGPTEEMLRHNFYSDQSRLNYIQKFSDKYSNFYDLLQNENPKLEDFDNYQRDLIEHLSAEGWLFVDSEDRVKMKNDICIYLIGELHRNEVISYWHYPKEVREELDEMGKDNLIRFGDTLFSEPELNYFNYYLNKKGYTNGLNIRNKYLHGSNSSSEKEHEYEYYILLKLVILSLLKIVDDLSLQKKLSDG